MDLRHVLVATHPYEINGVMWKKMFQRAGIDPKQLDIQTLDCINPKPQHNTIIALGESGLRSVLGEQDLFRWRGRTVSSTRYGRPMAVIPTLAPSQLLPRWGDDEDEDDDATSPLMRNPPRFQGMWVRDVQHAIQTNGVVPKFKTNYIVDPSLTVWNQIVYRYLKAEWLNFDIETIYKLKNRSEDEWEASELPIGSIIRISFAISPFEAVSVPWAFPYLDGIRMLLASSQNKVGWNCAAFDVPRLEQAGYSVGGIVYDAMDAWHLYRSEQPAGLEYVSSVYTPFLPWKHLNGSDPGIYSCIDSDANLQCFFGIKQDLERMGMWQLYMDASVELMPILKEAGQRGNFIDIQYSRQLEAEIEREKAVIEAKVQPLAPIEIRPRKRFKRTPEGLDDSTRTFVEVRVPGSVKRCTHCGQVAGNASEHFKGGKKNNLCKAAGAKLEKHSEDVIEWDEILPFNINSSDQMKDYIRHFKHPMGKNHKTDADSASSKHLEKLAKKYGDKHPIYALKVEYAKMAKTASTYIYYRYAGSDGKIHTTYVNAPSTWRLASRNVNLQNVGKREGNKWAAKARKQIVSGPGLCFVQADSTSIEAVLVGYLIGDDNFIRLANKSIHAWLSCMDLGIPWEDGAKHVIDLVKSKHKAVYDKFKVAIYLLLYGGDPYLMYMTEPDTFKSLAGARAVKDKIFHLIPKLKEYQDQVRAQAKKEGYLVSPFGYRHYFYDVYTFSKDKKSGKYQFNEDGTPKIKLGKDAKTSLAFKPQNSAAAICRQNLLLIGRSKWRKYMVANVSVHDGYTLAVPPHLAEEAAEFLVTVLTRPIPELGGLRIGCEVEIGPENGNWSDYDPKDNPLGLKRWKKVEM